MLLFQKIIIIFNYTYYLLHLNQSFIQQQNQQLIMYKTIEALDSSPHILEIDDIGKCSAHQ